MKVGSSTYAALAGMHKGTNNTRKQTADLAGATQMKGQVENMGSSSDFTADKTATEQNSKPSKDINKTIGTIIDVKV